MMSFKKTKVSSAVCIKHANKSTFNVSLVQDQDNQHLYRLVVRVLWIFIGILTAVVVGVLGIILWKQQAAYQPFSLTTHALKLHKEIQAFKYKFMINSELFLNGFPSSEYPVLTVHNFYAGIRKWPHYSLPIKQNAMDNVLVDSNATISMDEFFTDNSRHIMLVAGPGAGKTNMLKKYALRVVNDNMPALSHIELVFFIFGGTLNFDSDITMKELLVDYMTPDVSKPHMEKAFEWIVKNQCKCLFIIDGIDHITTWDLKHVQMKVGYDRRVKVSVLIYNLFAGNLFPDSKILTSSREHAIFDIHSSARPSKTVALVGFISHSIDNLFRQQLGNDSVEELLQTLKEENHALYSLCRTPIFLIFISSLFKDDKMYLKFVTETPSGVMMFILLNLIQSKHCSNRHNQTETVLHTFPRMQKLAYTGMEMGRVVFSMNDLFSHNLSIDNVCLMITVPVPVSLHANTQLESENIVKGRLHANFMHSTIQEALAALHIILNFDDDQFNSYLHNYLFEPRWTEVNKILTGVLLNRKTRKIVEEIFQSIGVLRAGEALNVTKKRQSLAYIFRASAEDTIDLDLIVLLHEAGEGAVGFIKNHVKRINVGGFPLSVSQFYILGSIVKKCASVELLRLRQNTLSKRQCHKFHNYITSTETKIKTLDLRNIEFLDPKSMHYIAEIVAVAKVEHLNMADCSLSTIHLQQLRDSLHIFNVKLKTLDLSHLPHGDSITKRQRLFEPFVTDKLKLITSPE